MSNCGNCGASTGCTCSFISNPSATVTGNGRTYAAINFHPNNVPSPRPYGELRRVGGSQVIPGSSIVAVIFDEVMSVFDGGSPGVMTNIPVTPTRLTVPTGGDGYYLSFGYIMTDGNNNPSVVIRKNGTINLEGQIGVSQPSEKQAMTLINMVAGDYLELVVYTDVVGASVITTGGYVPFINDGYPVFWAQWVRPL